MMKVQPSPAATSGAGDILAIGFGTTVAMWAVGYVGYMPLTQVRPAVFLTLMLACLVAGGWVAGRYTRRGVRGGLWVGLVSAMLNLLILGSLLLKPPGVQAVPHAWLWLPGAFVASAALAAGGALCGKPAHARCGARAPNWRAAFAWAACVAALLLITVGGLVTGFRAGMAVPDWPGSFQYNMFLYPLATMTGGVFYEHAHRLLGTLLGAGTLMLAIHLTVTRCPRKKVAAVWAIGACVLIQGVLGGFRVTEDSYVLAVIHGAFAHAVLAGLVVVAVMLSRGWEERQGGEVRDHARTDRLLAVFMVALTLVQTLLGVLVRQLNVLLLTHISLAAIVALAALGAGMRAWGLNPQSPALRRSGAALMFVVMAQILLGITAVAFRTPHIDQSPRLQTLADLGTQLPVPPIPAIITTLHQANAAVMLWAAAALAAWTWRLLAPPEAKRVVTGERRHAGLTSAAQ